MTSDTPDAPGIEPAAILRLVEQLAAEPAVASHFRAAEPNWDAVIASAGLPPALAGDLVNRLRLVWRQAFGHPTVLVDLLVFQFGRLQGIRADAQTRSDEHRIRLIRLFELLLTLAQQGVSLFPADAIELARRTRLALESPAGDPELDPLLGLFVPDAAGPLRTGYNSAVATDPGLILRHEHERRRGQSEHRWKQSVKYTEYRERVQKSPEFQSDWAALKLRFRVGEFADKQGIIRRSALPEGGHPHRSKASDLRKTKDRFRLAFDCFCWKWFLYAMRGDEPLPEKLTFTVTPQGTQIFIPGYWSFDAARDVDWKAAVKLHRARGVQRQGVKLAANRKDRLAQMARLRAAVEEARHRKVRGEARMRFLKQQAGFSEQTDSATIRRLLREIRGSRR